MGRKRKFTIGEIVTWQGKAACVVAYRQDAKGRGEYRVNRLIAVSGARAYGPAVWVASNFLSSHPWPHCRPNVVTTYRANQRLGKDRDCSCNCCPHVRIPPSVVRSDGTLVGDEDGGP